MKIGLEMALQRIRVYAFAVQGWTKKELADRADVSENTLRHIHDSDWNTSLDTIRRLESVIPEDWEFEEVPKMFNPPRKENTNA